MTLNNRSKLVIIDMQNDFHPSESVIKAVVDKIEKYKAHNCKIYMTMDMHDAESYPYTLESASFDPHCIRGTDGSALVDKVGTALALYRRSMKIFEKDSYGSMDLAKVLSEDYQEGDTIEVCGVCTEICVATNVAMIMSRINNPELYVDSAATEGLTKEAKDRALAYMARIGATIL